jgi:hypothetical protein
MIKSGVHPTLKEYFDWYDNMFKGRRPESSFIKSGNAKLRQFPDSWNGIVEKHFYLNEGDRKSVFGRPFAGNEMQHYMPDYYRTRSPTVKIISLKYTDDINVIRPLEFGKADQHFDASKYEFVMIFFNVNLYEEPYIIGQHCNVLLLNVNTGVLEFYDPYNTIWQRGFDRKRLYDNLPHLIKDITSVTVTQLIKPKEIMKELRVEELEEPENQVLCFYWCLVIIDTKIFNPKLSIYEIRQAIHKRYNTAKEVGFYVRKMCLFTCLQMYRILTVFVDEIRNPVIRRNDLVYKFILFQDLLIRRTSEPHLQERRSKLIRRLHNPIEYYKDRLKVVNVERTPSGYTAHVTIDGETHYGKSDTEVYAIDRACLQHVFTTYEISL